MWNLGQVKGTALTILLQSNNLLGNPESWLPNGFKLKQTTYPNTFEHIPLWHWHTADDNGPPQDTVCWLPMDNLRDLKTSLGCPPGVKMPHNQIWLSCKIDGLLSLKQWLDGFYGSKNIFMNTGTWGFPTRTLNCSHDQCHLLVVRHGEPESMCQILWFKVFCEILGKVTGTVYSKHFVLLVVFMSHICVPCLHFCWHICCNTGSFYESIRFTTRQISHICDKQAWITATVHHGAVTSPFTEAAGVCTVRGAEGQRRWSWTTLFPCLQKDMVSLIVICHATPVSTLFL